MAEICYDVAAEDESVPSCKPNTKTSRRRRMEIRRFKFVEAATSANPKPKKQKVDIRLTTGSPLQYEDMLGPPRQCSNAVQSSTSEEQIPELASDEVKSVVPGLTKYGVMSVCGRRRDMEDSVSIHPLLLAEDREGVYMFDYYAVFDGHGCSHVATWCTNRLHEFLCEELKNDESNWEGAIERSFSRMDEAAEAKKESALSGSCRCELQTPRCDAVGSTAVVAVLSHDKIVVANCGDSRAVLCRNGKPVPLSSDHKPDRPDEFQRIQSAGGRVIYWDGPRVMGVLAMSRAIGDSYLKPFVSSLPEVTVMERTEEDEFLILASDGLWDVVANDTACEIVRMCLSGRGSSLGSDSTKPKADGPDKVCEDAALLLTKLALARHSADNISVIVVDLRRDT